MLSLSTIPNKTDCKPILIRKDTSPPSVTSHESLYTKPETYALLFDQERKVSKIKKSKLNYTILKCRCMIINSVWCSLK